MSNNLSSCHTAWLHETTFLRKIEKATFKSSLQRLRGKGNPQEISEMSTGALGLIAEAGQETTGNPEGEQAQDLQATRQEEPTPAPENKGVASVQLVTVPDWKQLQLSQKKKKKKGKMIAANTTTDTFHGNPRTPETPWWPHSRCQSVGRQTDRQTQPCH